MSTLTPQQLEEKMVVGDQILDAFTVGMMGEALGINGSKQLQVTAADLWANVFGAEPPESGITQRIKAGSKLFNWLKSKGSQIAKASKGKVGPAFKTAIGAALLAPVSYGAYVWLSEEDRANARKMDAQKEAILDAAQIEDPVRQKQALDAISGMGARPLGNLPWIAIIAGIGVIGVIFWTRRGK